LNQIMLDENNLISCLYVALLNKLCWFGWFTPPPTNKACQDRIVHMQILSKSANYRFPIFNTHMWMNISFWYYASFV
jgi:hypothetical protein